MPEGFPAGRQAVQDRGPHLAGDERFGDVGVVAAAAAAIAALAGATTASMVDFRIGGGGVLVGVVEAHARPDEDLLESEGGKRRGDPMTAEEVPEAGDEGGVVVHGQAVDYIEEDLGGELVDGKG